MSKIPELPPGIVPMNFAQMYEHLLDAIPDPSRARAGVQRLIDSRYVEWWGMDEDNQPIYIPQIPPIPPPSEAPVSRRILIIRRNP